MISSALSAFLTEKETTFELAAAASPTTGITPTIEKEAPTGSCHVRNVNSLDISAF